MGRVFDMFSNILAKLFVRAAGRYIITITIYKITDYIYYTWLVLALIKTSSYRLNNDDARINSLQYISIPTAAALNMLIDIDDGY
jgi:hypothetical protein